MIEADGGGFLRRHPSLIAAGVICLIALALMSPELVLGLTYTDSFRFNYVWTEQFSRQFIAGNPYPRWLSGSWDGLGSPAFYFYPPLFFWVAALARVIAFGTIDADAAATCATLIMLVASGLAMRSWLAVHRAGRGSLLGAIAYMAAPYHLYDIFGRGALAEACSYALLPLIMLSLRHLAHGRRTPAALLALSYAGLILAHLPLALLTSATIMPLYILYCLRFEAADRRRFVILSTLAVVLGLGLAAIYVLPAIALLPHIATEALNSRFYVPESQFWWPPSELTDAYRMVIIISITLGWMLLALSAAIATWSTAMRWQGVFWFGLVGLGVIMISGAAPFVWELPLLAQVQFPFRMLPIVEFATVTALVIARPPMTTRSGMIGLGALAFGSVLVIMLAIGMLDQTRREGAAAQAYLARFLPDAPEYLPQGHPIPLDSQSRAYVDPAIVPRLPLASSPDARTQVIALAQDGSIHVDVDSPVSSVIIVRRFAFPHWRLEAVGGGHRPTLSSWGDQRLVSWQAEAGKSSYILVSGRAPIERQSWVASVLAVTLLTAYALWAWRRDRALASHLST